MSNYFYKSKQWANWLLKQGAELLSPSGPYCMLCARVVRHRTAQKQLPRQLIEQLCWSCLQNITWLGKLQCPYCGRDEHCQDCEKREQTYFVCNRSAVSYSDPMREWLAQYKYRGDERLAPLLALMLCPAFEKLTEQLLRLQPKSVQQEHKSWLNKPALFSNLWSEHLWTEKKEADIKAVTKAESLWSVVTFVPSSPERQQERGFNQAEQLAAYLAKRYRLPLYDLLVRKRHTDKMSLQPRQSRLDNADNLFGANEEEMAFLVSHSMQKQQQYKDQQSKNLEQASRQKVIHNRVKRTINILIVDDIYTTGATANACSKALLENWSSSGGNETENLLQIFFLTWARS